MSTICPANTDDQDAIRALIEPVIKMGDTYIYAPDSTRAQRLAIWSMPGQFTYVAELVGTFYQPGQGAYVARLSSKLT
ncbi:hypothetical protein [Fibrella arboris]|uniref:hypothetical protein n=1 Tax=Fibrella arboris TaxID=3242486 RepID=UPI0035207CD5